MRVLHVYSGNLFGGIEAILLTLARHQADCPSLAGETALCFDGRLSRELEAAGAPVHRLPEVRASRPQTVRRARAALARLLATGRFDRAICHAAWSQAIFGGVVRRAGVPLAFWAHDAMTGRPWTERWARRVRPDLAICNSAFTARSVEAVYPGVPREVVYAPVEVTPPRLTAAERRLVRAGLDTPADAVVVVQASRSEAWKGHASVVEALGRLRHVPNWIWWQVGGAQRPSETAFLDSLAASARRLRIAGRVRFVGERADVPRLLAAADVHCQANLKPEPFGIALVEALAAGLPVVTTALGGAVEIVDDTCGMLVPPGDVPALAAALERLIVDESFRARLAAGAPARAARLCEPSARVGQLADVLSRMAA